MRRHRTAAERRRAGYLAPALAAALLTAFLVGALVLNVGWRRAAERGIVSAVDAAALAAAAELACDERLVEGPLPRSVFERVAARAEELASGHRIVGIPATVAADGLRCGRRIVSESGRSQILDTDYLPTAVEVTVQRGQDGQLPWLFRAGPYTSGRLSMAAEAEIDARVATLRPRAGGTCPVWPVALLAAARASENAADTSGVAVGWRDQVEAGLGPDRFSYDRASKRVAAGGDGLPELVAETLRPGGESDQVGLTLVDIGQTFAAARLDRAFGDGMASEDLSVFGGLVPVASLPNEPVTTDALPRLPIEAERHLVVGDSRAMFLFESLTDSGGGFTVRLVGVVVARLMDLRPAGDGAWQATFQPAVLATGTAVLADAGDGDVPEGRYLYKVRLTR